MITTNRLYDPKSCYRKNFPYVDDNGIHVPINEFSPADEESLYRTIITKEIFIEAYNKWIRGKTNE